MIDLHGKSILITRPREKAIAMATLVQRYHGEPVICPTIEIAAPINWNSVDETLADIPQYDWLIFSSVHGVHYFLSRLDSVSSSAALQQMKIAAVGRKTADRLDKHGVKVDVIPREYNAESLLNSLGALPISGKKLLLVTGDKSLPTLYDSLSEFNAQVDRIVVYRNIAADAGQIIPVINRLQTHEIDYLTFTSPSTFHNFLELMEGQFENPQPVVQQQQIVVIGPVTGTAVQDAGFTPTVTAEESTIEGILTAIAHHIEIEITTE